LPLVSALGPVATVPPGAPDTSAIFPHDVLVVSSPVLDATAELVAGEGALVARAVPKRRHEFATGRRLAHQLLARLGAPDDPLLADADRAPIWPVGVIGSISHSHGLCIVAAAKRGASIGLGIDVEQALAVRPEVWRRVLCDDEERWLRSRPLAEQLPLAAVFFSAKEAVYKAQFPLTRARLGFHDVSLELDPVRRAFRAKTPGFPRPLDGAYAVGAPWVLTGLVLRAGDLPA
jgi:4'-phosphopantetheinyl transferase EntD